MSVTLSPGQVHRDEAGVRVAVSRVGTSWATYTLESTGPGKGLSFVEGLGGNF